MDSFREYLLDYEFTACFQSKDVEQVWAIIKSALYEAMDLYIPKVKLKRYKHPCWFNSGIRHHLECLRSLRKKCKSHPTDDNLSKLKTSEKQLQDEMLSAKSSYETQVRIHV